jgi:hypothetical protein
MGWQAALSHNTAHFTRLKSQINRQQIEKSHTNARITEACALLRHQLRHATCGRHCRPLALLQQDIDARPSAKRADQFLHRHHGQRLGPGFGLGHTDGPGRAAKHPGAFDPSLFCSGHHDFLQSHRFPSDTNRSDRLQLPNFGVDRSPNMDPFVHAETDWNQRHIHRCQRRI